MYLIGEPCETSHLQTALVGVPCFDENTGNFVVEIVVVVVVVDVVVVVVVVDCVPARIVKYFAVDIFVAGVAVVAVVVVVVVVVAVVGIVARV
ncbi:MAG: hypothetical protein AAFQ69_21405, partial [Pseudomonadota bacterium]